MSYKGIVSLMSSLKRKLKNEEAVLGTWITINHPDVVDALSELPLDWLVFDMEHAPLEISDVEVLLMPLRGVDISPIIRVPWNDMVIIKRALDIGAEGILVPWVNSREEAEKAVSYASYPPRGLRGVGPRRAVRYGQRSLYFLGFLKKEKNKGWVLLGGYMLQLINLHHHSSPICRSIRRLGSLVASASPLPRPRRILVSLPSPYPSP